MGCCCGGNCPCCPNWPLTASGSIAWTSLEDVSDCGGGSPYELTTDFGCPNADSDFTLIASGAGGARLIVRVYCDSDQVWKVQYKSPTSGGGFNLPNSDVWADATEVEFVCPSCPDSPTGTIDFVASSACEISGPTIVPFSILCHGVITIGCP